MDQIQIMEIIVKQSSDSTTPESCYFIKYVRVESLS